MGLRAFATRALRFSRTRSSSYKTLSIYHIALVLVYLDLNKKAFSTRLVYSATYVRRTCSRFLPSLPCASFHHCLHVAVALADTHHLKIIGLQPKYAPVIEIHNWQFNISFMNVRIEKRKEHGSKKISQQLTVISPTNIISTTSIIELQPSSDRSMFGPVRSRLSFKPNTKGVIDDWK